MNMNGSHAQEQINKLTAQVDALKKENAKRRKEIRELMREVRDIYSAIPNSTARGCQ